jgi:hypothetical protein
MSEKTVDFSLAGSSIMLVSNVSDRDKEHITVLNFVIKQ